MSKVRLTVLVEAVTSDQDTAELYKFEHEYDEGDATGLIGWLEAMFSKWFWS